MDGRPTRRSDGEQTETFKYDSFGRLTVFTRSGGDSPTEVAIEYDSIDLIRRLVVDGEARNWVWDLSGSLPRLLEERSDTGSLVRRYVNGPFPIAIASGSSRLFLHPGHLGSIEVVTNETGQIYRNFSYEAYGTERQGSVDPDTPLQYVGQYYLPELGLYYMRQRFYDPVSGRFLTPDVIEASPDVPLSYNPYLYAANNPTRFIDPLGTFSLGELNIVVSVIGLLASVTLPYYPEASVIVASKVGSLVSEIGKLRLVGASFSGSISSVPALVE